MQVLIICILLTIGLFFAAFSSKRRFGLLGLALASGSLLSSIWGYDAGLIASGLGIPSGPLTSAITLSIIVLLPAGLLLFHGYTYKTLIGRLVGSGLFTLLAIAFLIEPIGHVFVLQGLGANIYNTIVANRELIIGAGLIVAVVDIFLTKPAKSSEKRH